MGSINNRIKLEIPVKEAIYKSSITGGITKIQIKEFVASFPIHTKKSLNGDFYPTSFNILVVSEIGHEYKLEDLELIDDNQKRCESFAGLVTGLEKIQNHKNKMKEAIKNGNIKEYIESKR